VTSRRSHKYFSLVVFCTVLFQCSGPRFIDPDPPGTDSGKQLPGTEDNIDFSEAFEPDIDPAHSSSPAPVVEFTGTASFRFPLFSVGSGRVRVALIQNVSSVNLYSVGTVDIKTSDKSRLEPFRGRLAVKTEKESESVLLTASWGSKAVSLPCTLYSSKNDYNFIEAGQGSYRGSVILISEKKGLISVINYLDVEDYLRGVVPLEIGKRNESEIEALKAQAVAARTYTYRRIQERTEKPFDLICTVADQVYGGATVENRVSDLAVKLTKDLVLVHQNGLITAYYHSTCGGSTADIENVWDKQPCQYLRSIKDTDSLGRIYCRISPAFKWEEKWSKAQLSSIISKWSRVIDKGKEFKGDVRDIRIDKVFPCGRVEHCTIYGSHSSIESGRDIVRFIIRRASPVNAVLRSASFKVVSFDKNGIRISGTGYGHGVGMCQMGAVGRAIAGFNFEQILKAYYTGVAICTAVPSDRK